MIDPTPYFSTHYGSGVSLSGSGTALTTPLTPTGMVNYPDWEGILGQLVVNISNLDGKVEDLELKIKTYLVQSTPNIIPLNSLGSTKLELKKPLIASLEHQEDDFIMSLPDLNLWGSADTEIGARIALTKEVESFYFDLKKHQKKLGPEMVRLWHIANELVKEV